MPAQQLQIQLCVKILAFFCLVLTTMSPLLGQSDEAGSTNASDFRSLTDQRTKLENDVRDLQRKIDQLDLTTKQIAEAKKNLEYWKGEGEKESPAIAPREIRGWSGTLQSYREADVEKEIEDTSKTLAAKQGQLAAVESRINTAINIEKPKQDFKKGLSWVFAGLVAAVIAGFYGIALKNPAVGSSIFAGDAGLQFITLFSLVIAIILFGLTEVLQGRELAALLGGISGYILGRSSHAKN